MRELVRKPERLIPFEDVFVVNIRVIWGLGWHSS